MTHDLPPIVVQKFGGTTMQGDQSFSLVKCAIKRVLDSNRKVVAVVSAMGRGPDPSSGKIGDPYATDSLLGMLPSSSSFVCLREKDLVMMCGEIISAVALACQLRAAGVCARARTGAEAGIITDDNSTNARIKAIAPDRILNDLHIMDVVVIAGFQGISLSGKITTLGRGGSDTTAVAIGKALKAERTEIFTDQTGVFSADPRDVPDAVHLQVINAKDIMHMAWAGARVLHPRAAEIIDRFKLPVTVGSTKSLSEFTTIDSTEGMESSHLITAVAHGDVVSQFTVYSSINGNASFPATVFECISNASISMDMFTITESMLQFTVDQNNTHMVSAIMHKHSYSYSKRLDCKKVSVVGAGMHKMKGVMARFTRAMANAGVNIFQTTDSHATISALVNSSDARKAQQALHSEFIR
jgi:aspartate kinase